MKPATSQVLIAIPPSSIGHPPARRTRHGLWKLGAFAVLAAWSLAFLFCAPACSQSLALAGFTLFGSGGTSAGGIHALNGTAGQPCPGTIAGGGFTLMAGFWGGASRAALPPLQVRLEANHLVLSWPASAGLVRLQSATRLDPAGADWAIQPTDPVRAGDRFEVTIGPAATPPDPVRFFRLLQP